MDKEADPKTVITEEDYAWHIELYQAVLRFLYEREAYKRHPNERAGLDEAEEVLSQTSRTPASGASSESCH